MSDHEDAIGDNRLLVRDWELLGKAHTFLQPFASATLYAEGDDSSISQSLMLMDMLLLHYEEQQVFFHLSTSSRLITNISSEDISIGRTLRRTDGPSHRYGMVYSL